MWNEFENIFNGTYSHAPLRMLSNKERKFRSKPWITKGIIKSIRTKNIMFKIAIQNKSEQFSNNFKKYRNTLTRVKELSKKLFYKDSIKSSAGNSKKLWKTINDIITTKPTKSNNLKHIYDNTGALIEAPEEIGNIMNDNFISIPDKLLKNSNFNNNNEDSVINCDLSNNKNSFFLKPLNVLEITNFINNMDHKKSARSDTPKISFIKLSVDIIAPIITKIFNLCIQHGIFPESFKYAEVVPIFKSGSKANINNYRPISLLSPFSKIFESYICNQLTSFLDKNNILYRLQYGFRQDSSTELAVTQLVDDLIDAAENKLINCSIFLDLAKAFNTVNHKILLHKLGKYRVRGLPLLLIENFLKDRSQSTVINNSKSKSQEINVGVPQGSSLGPLLFLININDLPSSTNLKVRLFADDACVSYQHQDPSTLNEIINTELVKINDWLESNKLFINYSKSNFLIFNKTRKQHKFLIQLKNHTLTQVSSTKYLGVIIDDKLTWKPHINYLKSKLSRNCYALTRLKGYLDESVMKMVYYSLIYPHLQYCISSWGAAASSNIDPIIKLQKRIIRYICHMPARSHTNNLFTKTEILKFKDIFELQVCKLVHKYRNNINIGNNNTIPLENQHNYYTRLSSKSNYVIPQVRTNLGLLSFNYLGPMVIGCSFRVQMFYLQYYLKTS